MDEILQAEYGDNIHIIVETGGSKCWGISKVDGSMVNSEYIERYELKNRKKNLIDQLELADMSNPDTLADFLKWGVENYPAERYITILWDHGGGSIYGYGVDEFYPGNIMDVQEIQTAFKTAGYRFDVIGFDACLMATMETAYALRDYADYLVASEETENGYGWYYTEWVNALGEDPEINTLQVCKTIVDSFINKSSELGLENQTLAVLNLNHADEAVDILSGYFDDAINRVSSKDGFKTIATARDEATTFGMQKLEDGKKYDSFSQIDLIDFLTLAGVASEEEIVSTFCGDNNLIVYENDSYERSNGVALYFPNLYYVSPDSKDNGEMGNYEYMANVMKKMGYRDTYFRFFDAFFGRVAEINGWNFTPQCNAETTEDDVDEQAGESTGETIEPATQDEPALNDDIEEVISQESVSNSYVGPKLTEDGFLPVQKNNETGGYYVDMTEMPEEWRQNLKSISYINCIKVNDNWYIVSNQTYDPLMARAFFGSILSTFHMFQQYGGEAAASLSEEDLYDEFGNPGVNSEEDFLTQQAEDLKNDRIYISPTADCYSIIQEFPVVLLDTGIRTDTFGYYCVPAVVNGVESNIYYALDARKIEDGMFIKKILGYAHVDDMSEGNDLRCLMDLGFDDVCPEYPALFGSDRIQLNDSFKFDKIKPLDSTKEDPFPSYDKLGLILLKDAYGMQYLSEPIAIQEGED